MFVYWWIIGLFIYFFVLKKKGSKYRGLPEGSRIKYKRRKYLEHKHNNIFPLVEAKFEDVPVYLIKNYKQFSKKMFGKYPPLLPPESKRYCHEGSDIKEGVDPRIKKKV
jgi:hypothetical protein